MRLSAMLHFRLSKQREKKSEMGRTTYIQSIPNMWSIVSCCTTYPFWKKSHENSSINL